jgi:hypothetical protein
MHSPFPGMDPYLEARWSNVHTTLIAAIQEVLQPALPQGLRARAEERVLLAATDDEVSATYRSDVAVIESKPAEGARSTSTPVATVEPVLVGFHDDATVERWVQIIDTTDGHRVVSAIEVLSPSNKAPGRLNVAYCRKLDDYRRGGVSLVEIDLLRYPTRARMPVRTDDLPAQRRTPYVVCIRRAWQPNGWTVYPIPLRLRLPVIPVPLRRADPEVGLDLQQLIEHTYRAGGHDDIDYARALDPPLSEPDTAWARELLGKR